VIVNVHTLPDAFGPVAIVGGRGRMGAMFSALLKETSIECELIDIDTSRKDRDAVLSRVTTLLISVPINITVSVIEEIRPILRPGMLLVDLTSIKEQPLQAMLRYDGEVLALHPMFGSTQGGITGQTIVNCGGRIGPRATAFLEFLQQKGAKVHPLTAKRHDQLMAIVQGLNHFHAIACAHALGELGVAIEETIAVASPVYLLRMQLIGRILAQDPGLYADILLHNSSVPRALETFISSCSEFQEAIVKGSREECIEFFNRAASVFGDYKEVALTESNALLDKAR